MPGIQPTQVTSQHRTQSRGGNSSYCIVISTTSGKSNPTRGPRRRATMPPVLRGAMPRSLARVRGALRRMNSRRVHFRQLRRPCQQPPSWASPNGEPVAGEPAHMVSSWRRGRSALPCSYRRCECACERRLGLQGHRGHMVNALFGFDIRNVSGSGASTRGRPGCSRRPVGLVNVTGAGRRRPAPFPTPSGPDYSDPWRG